MVRLRSLVVWPLGAGSVAAVEGVGVDAAFTGMGTWTPTLTWTLYCLAAAWRPLTKGDSASDFARERDSSGEVAI